MNIEVNYYEELITITAYNENDKNKIEDNLKKEKKIYMIFEKRDIEDYSIYYVFIIFKELKGEY